MFGSDDHRPSPILIQKRRRVKHCVSSGSNLQNEHRHPPREETEPLMVCVAVLTGNLKISGGRGAGLVAISE